MPISVKDTWRLNIELQALDMYREVWRDQVYLRWVQFANREPQEKGSTWLKPQGAMSEMKMAKVNKQPIVVWENFKTNGTDLQILTKRLKHHRFVYGDDTLQGKGIGSKWVYQNLRVNAISDVIPTKSGHYSEQVYAKYINDLVKQAKPELQDRMSRYINNAMVKHAFYYGASYELILPTSSFGRGLTKWSHPNMWVANNGWVSFNANTGVYTNLPRTSAYEADVETAVDSLTNIAACHFSTALLDKLSVMLPKKRILPSVNIAGNNYYVMVISSMQKYQLYNDTTYNDIIFKLLPRETDPFKNWLLQGCAGAYRNFLFVEDAEAWGVHTNTNPEGYTTSPTAGQVAFGVEDLATGDEFKLIKDIDYSNYSTAVILGERALDIGIAKQLQFTEEVYDHKRKSEIGDWWIAGAERPDQIDSDNQLGNGADAFVDNTGSAMVVTYSPTITS